MRETRDIRYVQKDGREGNNMKEKIWNVLGWAVISICLPYIVTILWSGQAAGMKEELNYSGLTVAMEYDTVDLEQFLIYMTAALIPPDYQPEAIKAQAVVGRTWLRKQFGDEKTMNVQDLGVDFLDYQGMKSQWGDQAQEYYEKIETAVTETAGKTLRYDGVLIDAMFHRASSGMTRTAGQERPYLVSVESSDLDCDGFLGVYVETPEKTAELLNQKKQEGEPDNTGDEIRGMIQMVERDSAGYVMAVQIGNGIYTGDEVMQALNLPSSCFSVEMSDGNVRFTCKGIGHGYGLSQWGANRMAGEGKSYDEILTYFYQNIQIVSDF